jgi:hypothetical protein
MPVSHIDIRLHFQSEISKLEDDINRLQDQVIQSYLSLKFHAGLVTPSVQNLFPLGAQIIIQLP